MKTHIVNIPVHSNGVHRSRHGEKLIDPSTIVILIIAVVLSLAACEREMSRMVNGCEVRCRDGKITGFECIAHNSCEFALRNEINSCILAGENFKCLCEKAQNDALSRAASAINEEQCRRANARESTEEEVERKR